MKTNSTRLQVVDALRGFAIVAITLLHNIEHYDFYFTPTNLPSWMPAVDLAIWNTLFFLFSGKAYAIFALLFGLTYYIQSNNQTLKGNDFRARFAWRLTLLLGFSLVNSLFYQGDILGTYAIIGFALLPVSKLSNRAVLGIAIFLILQPFEWINVFVASQNPTITPPDPISWSYFAKMDSYIKGSSFLDTCFGNITNGRIAVIHWTWESGRVFQTASLFMLGMLAGRTALFASSKETYRIWRNTLVLSALAFVPLFLLSTNLNSIVISQAISKPLYTIISSWSNMAFMLVLVSGFFLLFESTIFNKPLSIFAPLGKMSLSNYIMQSIIGSFIYYGFGLGLYQYTGATYSLIIGVTLASGQCLFSHWWMNNHKQGPLENLWHKATWMNWK